MEIVNENELEPARIAEVLNADGVSQNSAVVEKRHEDKKDWQKRCYKAV